MIRLRRFLALLLLLAITVSTAEAVIGDLREVEMHSESTPTALVHGSLPRDHHGPEGGDSHSHSQGGEHRHATSAADHCAHQHGTPLTSTFTFALGTPVVGQPAAEDTLYFEHTPLGLLRPPRA